MSKNRITNLEEFETALAKVSLQGLTIVSASLVLNGVIERLSALGFKGAMISRILIDFKIINSNYSRFRARVLDNEIKTGVFSDPYEFELRCGLDPYGEEYDEAIEAIEFTNKVIASRNKTNIKNRKSNFLVIQERRPNDSTKNGSKSGTEEKTTSHKPESVRDSSGARPKDNPEIWTETPSSPSKSNENSDGDGENPLLKRLREQSRL